MDPKLFDIQRIEVLRGPQGTLYGANSMGGPCGCHESAVQDRFVYRGDATSIHEFGAPSYETNGMVNVPLIGMNWPSRPVYDSLRRVMTTTHRRRHPLSHSRDVDGESAGGARCGVLAHRTGSSRRLTPPSFR